MAQSRQYSHGSHLQLDRSRLFFVSLQGSISRISVVWRIPLIGMCVADSHPLGGAAHFEGWLLLGSCLLLLAEVYDDAKSRKSS
jgi:hypothetical protein